MTEWLATLFSLPYRSPVSAQKVDCDKRGIVADAIGKADIAIHGVAGELILSNVLHVPNLAGPLFSVQNALASTMSVHFHPPDEPCSHDRVDILHGHHVLFTADQRSGLYFIDSPRRTCTSNILEAANHIQ